MICPKCGSDNKDTAKFCNECGSSLAHNDEASADGAIEDADQEDIGSKDTFRFTSVPEIDPIEDEAAEVPEDPEFDFSPIEIPDSDGHVDTSGIDEYLVEAGYSAPKPSWKTGDTMEMPRVDGEEAPKQKEYRVAAEPEKKRGGKRIALAIAAVILVLAVAAIGTTYYYELWGGKSLPDVVGLDQAEATSILESKNFVAKTMQVKSDDTEGIVLLMDPGAGKRLAQGSEVVLQVAVSRSVPEVTGLSREEAEKVFSQDGFQKVTYVEEKSDAPEGSVLSVEPVAGTKASAAMPITVKVAIPYTVPDVLGKDQAGATQLLSDAGFETYAIWVYSEAPEWTVIASDPEAGAVLASGSTVTIQIAKSRATELINATYDYLGRNVGSTLELGGTTYEVRSVDGVTYEGGNKTSATVSVVGVTTLADGEVLTGDLKQRTMTLTWNDDGTIQSYS